MKPEHKFWNEVARPNLRPFGIFHRVENTAELGTPDVTYTIKSVSGWIELKHAYRWKRLFTFDNYTVDQANWLHEWGKHGGRAFVLAKIGVEYLLVPWQHCRELQKGATQARVYDMAAVWGDGSFPTGRIIKCLAT